MRKSKTKQNRKLYRLAISLFVGLWAATPGMLNALPNGGEIISGTGSISQTAQDMVIQQNTQQLITNWQEFSIGSTESVTFNQPNANAVALNRVIGADPSMILGKLSANGQVFLTNPSGVVFGAGSVVDVHGLLATTLNISDTDFLAGRYQFSQDPKQPLSALINEGIINAKNYVGLLAPAVENNGSIIVADMGSVTLGSGTAATLDFNGDGLISFVVTEEVSGDVADPNNTKINLKNRILNSGIIQANGGQVLLTAKSASNVISNVVNHTGLIEAQTVMQKDGKIILSGGNQGIVRVSGKLDASGNQEGEQGGTVNIIGEKVGLFDTAQVDVAGHSGGGTVLMGGDYQGSGNLSTAQASYVGEETEILADARGTGDGGIIVVWSDEVTRVHGNISARGGSESGNGGLVETSGSNGLEITRNPDISAPNGEGGLWLIDPDNIEVIAGSSHLNINEESPFEPTADAKLGVDLIQNALIGGSNVEVSTTGDVESGDFSGSIFWKADLDYVGTGKNTLTLSAHHDIQFNESIYTSDPNAADQLNLNLIADSDGNANGTVTVAENKSLMTNGGDIIINADDLALIGYLDSGTGDIKFTRTANSNLTLSPSGSMKADIGVSHITAENLRIITDGSILVKGTDEKSTQGISGTVFFDSGNNVIFNGEGSVFSALNVSAINNINVNQNVTTTQNDFIAKADSDNDGKGTFNVDPGVVITSARDIDVSAPLINAEDHSFNESRDLILNGAVIGPPLPPEPPANPVVVESIQQGSLGSFLTEFFENGGSSGGC